MSDKEVISARSMIGRLQDSGGHDFSRASEILDAARDQPAGSLVVVLYDGGHLVSAFDVDARSAGLMANESRVGPRRYRVGDGVELRLVPSRKHGALDGLTSAKTFTYP